MTSIYASNTSVSIDKSQTEIKKTLQRYGADGFVFGESRDRAMVQFEMRERRIKFVLPLPPKPERTTTRAQSQFEQTCRSRWRSLSLAIKAKLECVNSGIGTFDEEFLAHIVLPNGRTVGESVVEQIAGSYRDGSMPPLLGGRADA